MRGLKVSFSLPFGERRDGVRVRVGVGVGAGVGVGVGVGGVRVGVGAGWGGALSAVLLVVLQGILGALRRINLLFLFLFSLFC